MRRVLAMIAAGCAHLVVLSLVGIYVLLCALFWWAQESFLFPIPTWATRASLDEVAASRGTEIIELVADDGVPLYAWRQRAPADRLVLFFSGNGEALSDYLPLHDMLAAEGWDMLTVAWHGYPGSGGAPGQAELASDARAAWAWAVGPGGYSPKRIVVHGRSLGGAVAAELVYGPADPAALVLESTFARVGPVMASYAPFLPISWLLRHPFRTLDRAPHLGVDTLVLHSADDQLIPPDLGGRRLAAAIPGARYVETHGWSHQDNLPIADAEVGRTWLEFLEAHVPP